MTFIKKLVVVALLGINSLAWSEGMIINDLVDSFYYRQTGLMANKEEYRSFILPYFQRAQKELKIVEYFIEHDIFPITSEYRNCLLNYNVAFFNRYIKPSKQNKEYFKACEENLWNIISCIQKMDIINGLNASQEFKNTKRLFKEANKAYYKRLGFGKKCALWGYRHFSF